MSLTAQRQPKAIRIRAASTLQEALFEEGYEYVAGQLNDTFYKPWELSQDEADAIAAGKFRVYSAHVTQFELFLSGKSRGAKYMARKIQCGAQTDLKVLASDWAATKDLRKWLKGKGEDFARRLDVSVPKLMYLGIRFAWQAERFCALYEQIMVADRPWGSSYQPDHSKVKVIALTRNYKKLPLWVKRVFVNFQHWTQDEEGRIGNVWRLLDCAKAWKWSPGLPKGIAEKVGKMPVRSRIIAAIAWSNQHYPYGWNYQHRQHKETWLQYNWNPKTGEYDQVFISRADFTKAFWAEFQRLSKLPILSLLEEADCLGHNQKRVLVEQTLTFPFQLLWEDWGRKRDFSLHKAADVLATHGSPSDVCFHLFGCRGKTTVKAFCFCQSKNNWKWASVLCYGNPDAVQKVLKLKEIISYQTEAINFLKSLPLHSAIRMLSATTFKYRGQINPISDDHVRDTGYLWQNIRQKPELGRIRCWFSVHETLATAFVKELPDEALPIPQGWELLDGLCAVDGSWQIEFPKRVATLKYYGEVLHNCVGGYGPAIKSGRSIIFVIRESGLLTHCVEISNKCVNQFYRAGNSSPDYAIKSSVVAVLEQANLLL